MLSKDEIKAKLSISTLTPNYPIGSFVDWVERQYNREVLQLLEEVQRELYTEERAWQKAAAHGKVSEEVARIGHWCFYCAQVRAYYQAVVHDPQNKKRLSFLLRDK